MYILHKYYAVIGISIAALSTVFCPFLKVPLLGHWNLYQTDMFLFAITNGILALLILLFFIRNITAFRIVSYVFLAWCCFGLLGVYFKINNYFGMKLFDGMLSKTIHLKWGWFFLFIGALMVIMSVRKVKEIR